MNKRDKLTESAAAGAVSAGSIAVRQDAGGSHPHGMKRRGSLLDFLSSYQKKALGNRLNMKPVETPFKVSVKEDVSLDQIYSRMSGIENASRGDDKESVTYGVEDDNGNLMKITVNANNAEDFEVALAQELGEVESYKMTGRGGYGRDVSMAEVLFNLKQKFDIIDVEFPEIPKDKVYNADKVSDPSDLDTELDMDSDLPMGDSPEGGDDFDMDSPEGEGEGEDTDPTDPTLDLDSDEEGEGDEDLDTDLGAELSDEDQDEESILKQIVKMMSADAEAKKAQHEAEAEKYRAMQAEYTMKAAKQEMYKQEDLLKMEEEKEQQRKKEEEAKKMADLARYKLRGSVREGMSSFLSALVEISDLEDETTLRMQRRNVRDIDDPREKALQNQLINNKRRIVQRREQVRQQQEREQQQQDRRQQQDGNDAQQQNNAQRNQPVPDRRPIGGSNV